MTLEPQATGAGDADPPQSSLRKPGFTEEALPHMDALYRYSIRLTRGNRTKRKTSFRTSSCGRTSAAVVADGVEARLIEAEAALKAGNTARWLELHDALRADAVSIMQRRVPNFLNLVPTAQNLAPLTDPGAPQRVRIHFADRAFWLHLTGHRLGDLRRTMRQYGFGAEVASPPVRISRACGSPAGAVRRPWMMKAEHPNSDFPAKAGTQRR